MLMTWPRILRWKRAVDTTAGAKERLERETVGQEARVTGIECDRGVSDFRWSSSSVSNDLVWGAFFKLGSSR